MPLLPRLRFLYVDSVLTDEQINEFAERGFVLVPQVVQGDVFETAAVRINASAVDYKVVIANGQRYDRGQRQRAAGIAHHA